MNHETPDRPEHPELFASDTLGRKTLHADVLTRMFGEPDPEVVPTLGRYEIVRELGAGGMGVVYLAHDPELDRRVALKLLRPRAHMELSEDTENRLREEARAMARLNHPHVVNVHDVGRYEKRLFLAMEYVEGCTLGRWLSTPRERAEILRVFIEAGEGLEAAHDAQLVHRDFKPDNVLISDDGVVKVTDFGIALAHERWETRADTDGDEDPSQSVSMVMGTLRYMSPEQLRGAPVDARSDQFSFCVALYEALIGEHPFGCEQGVPDVSLERRPARGSSGVPSWLREALVRGMSARADDRWPSMHDLLHVLRRDPAARRKRWLMGATLTAAVGLLAFSLGRGASSEPEDPCVRGHRQAQVVWNDERRRAVSERFSEHRLSFGEASLAATVAPLDAWVDQWGGAYAELCGARHEQSDERYDARMTCLADQRQGVEAFVALLGEADGRVVRDAPRLAGDLPVASECVDSLLEVMAPPPRDAEEVAEIREQLQQIDTAIWADEQGLEQRVLQLRARAEALGYRPLVGEVMLIQASVARGENDRPAGLEFAREAYGVGLETGHDHLTLDAVTLLLRAEAEGLRTEVREYARERWNSTAVHMSQRLGVPVRHELNRRQAYVHVLRSHDRTTRWSEELEGTFEFLRSTVGLEHHYAIRPFINRARLYSSTMDYGRALADAERAEALTTAWVGPDHPEHEYIYEVKADILIAMGRYDEARSVIRRTLAIQGSYEGGQVDQENLGRLAQIEDELGDHAAARAAYEVLLGGPIPDGQTLTMDEISSANSLCFVDYKLEDYAQAHAVCEQVLVAVRRLWPHGSSMEGIVLNNEALIARAQGRFEEGLRIDREALQACERVEPPEPRAMVYSWVGIGESLLALGRGAEAVEPLTRVLELRRDSSIPPAELGEAECLLAQARWDAEPKTRAAALTQARQGLERLREGGRSWTRQLGACQAWLDAHESG